MPEVKYNYNCPKCNKAQGRLFRFPQETMVSHQLLVEKLRKTYFKCKYCGFKIKATKLEKKDLLGWDNILNTQTTAKINKLELR